MTVDPTTRPARLVLFDVDGTLLLSDNAGRAAMEAAGSTLFGRGFSCARVHFGGMLDTVIWSQLCEHNGVADTAVHHARFREAYARHLREELGARRRAHPLPGVEALVGVLQVAAEVRLGLLSGNYTETGVLKVDAAGLLSQRFTVHAWGDDASRREDLVPVALRRCGERHGWAPEPDQVVVVGDTPADVDAARAHGCRSLAVATGGYDVAALHAAGADLVVRDLTDTERITCWMGV